MKIFIGSDHRGFELKNQLVDWLKSKSYDVEDCGNNVYDPQDDYPEIAKEVIEALLKDLASFGILLCGSGIGVSIVANRYRGVRCALGFNPDQVAHGRTNDHINVLSIPSDFVDMEKAKELVKTFLETKPKMEEKYLERVKELDL